MHDGEVICCQLSGKLIVNQELCYENRGSSLEKMIRATIKKYNITRDFSIYISTSDIPDIQGIRFNYTTHNKNYSRTIPSYIFDHWETCGATDFEKLCSSFSDTIPLSAKCGFIGAPTHKTRINFRNKCLKNSKKFDFIFNDWIRTNKNLPLHLQSPSFMSFQEQINQWKYLIDIEGRGFSARLPILLRSPRICFIVDRPWEEFYYEYLKPWIHYVPVKRDLSDLEENYEKIESDLNLQNTIKQNQVEFSKKYLTWDSALDQMYKIIQSNFHLKN